MGEHDKGPNQIDRNQSLRINPILIRLRMQSPILRLIPQTLGFRLQNSGGRSLRDEEESNASEKRSHDECDPGCPTPAEVRLRDKAANDWACNGTREGTGSEDADGIGSLDRTPYVGKSASNNG